MTAGKSVSRCCVAVILMTCLPSGSPAQQAEDLPGLVVAAPRLSGLASGEVDPVSLSNLAGSVIAGLHRHKVITREDVVAVLGQARLAALLGCNEVKCMAELGLAMDAPYLYHCNVGRTGEVLAVSAVLIDNRKGEVLERRSITFRGIDRVLEAVQVVTLRLFGEQAEMAPPADYSVYRWTALGLGLAGAALGGIGTGLAFHYQGQADSAADQGDFNSHRASIDTWNKVSVTAYVTGGAFLVTALVFFLIPDEEPIEAGQAAPAPPPVSLAPIPDGGLMIQTGFRF